MLARRVVIRPATTLLRRGSQLQRGFILPFKSQLPRPNTWLAKIRFREDGKPRSKLIALGFGSLFLLNLFLLYSLFKVIKDGEIYQGFLARIIFVQHTDISYDSVNFDDPISTLSYFKKVYQSFTRDSEEDVDQMFRRMMQVFTETGSEKSAEVQALHIMRSAAEKIHNAFRELNPNTFGNTANFVANVIMEATDSLIFLYRDCIGEDYESRPN